MLLLSRNSASKGHLSIPYKPTYELKNHMAWRSVEVAGFFDPYQREAGGAFILRDGDRAPLLAQAFPIAGGPLILTEAVVVRQAVEVMVRLGEGNLLIRTSSPTLLKCFLSGEARGGSAVDGVVKDGIQWFRRASGFRLVHAREELVDARWLAESGARSQQHLQWDRPLMEEMLGGKEASAATAVSGG